MGRYRRTSKKQNKSSSHKGKDQKKAVVPNSKKCKRSRKRKISPEGSGLKQELERLQKDDWASSAVKNVESRLRVHTPTKKESEKGSGRDKGQDTGGCRTPKKTSTTPSRSKESVTPKKAPCSPPPAAPVIEKYTPKSKPKYKKQTKIEGFHFVSLSPGLNGNEGKSLLLSPSALSGIHLYNKAQAQTKGESKEVKDNQCMPNKKRQAKSNTVERKARNIASLLEEPKQDSHTDTASVDNEPLSQSQGTPDGNLHKKEECLESTSSFDNSKVSSPSAGSLGITTNPSASSPGEEDSLSPPDDSSMKRKKLRSQAMHGELWEGFPFNIQMTSKVKRRGSSEEGSSSETSTPVVSANLEMEPEASDAGEHGGQNKEEAVENEAVAKEMTEEAAGRSDSPCTDGSVASNCSNDALQTTSVIINMIDNVLEDKDTGTETLAKKSSSSTDGIEATVNVSTSSRRLEDDDPEEKSDHKAVTSTPTEEKPADDRSCPLWSITSPINDQCSPITSVRSVSDSEHSSLFHDSKSSGNLSNIHSSFLRAFEKFVKDDASSADDAKLEKPGSVGEEQCGVSEAETTSNEHKTMADTGGGSTLCETMASAQSKTIAADLENSAHLSKSAANDKEDSELPTQSAPQPKEKDPTCDTESELQRDEEKQGEEGVRSIHVEVYPSADREVDIPSTLRCLGALQHPAEQDTKPHPQPPAPQADKTKCPPVAVAVSSRHASPLRRLQQQVQEEVPVKRSPRLQEKRKLREEHPECSPHHQRQDYVYMRLKRRDSAENSNISGAASSAPAAAAAATASPPGGAEAGKEEENERGGDTPPAKRCKTEVEGAGDRAPPRSGGKDGPPADSLETVLTRSRARSPQRYGMDPRGLRFSSLPEQSPRSRGRQRGEAGGPPRGVDLLRDPRLAKHACLLWSSEQRRRFQQQHAELGSEQLDALMREQWAALGERERMRYYSRAWHAVNDKNARHRRGGGGSQGASVAHRGRAGTRARSSTAGLMMDELGSPGLTDQVRAFHLLSPPCQFSVLRRKLSELQKRVPQPEYNHFIAGFLAAFAHAREQARAVVAEEQKEEGEEEGVKQHLDGVARRLMYARLVQAEQRTETEALARQARLRRQLLEQYRQLLSDLIHELEPQVTQDMTSCHLTQILDDLEGFEAGPKTAVDDDDDTKKISEIKEDIELGSLTGSLTFNLGGLKVTVPNIENTRLEVQLLKNAASEPDLPTLSADDVDSFFESCTEDDPSLHDLPVTPSEPPLPQRPSEAALQSTAAACGRLEQGHGACCSLDSVSCLLAGLVARERLRQQEGLSRLEELLRRYDRQESGERVPQPPASQVSGKGLPQAPQSGHAQSSVLHTPTANSADQNTCCAPNTGLYLNANPRTEAEEVNAAEINPTALAVDVKRLIQRASAHPLL